MFSRARTAKLLAATCLLAHALPAVAVDVAVIVARDAPPQTLNAGMLRDIYLKKIVIDDAGRKWVPVNLPADAPLRQMFTQALFHKSSEELQDYWNQNYFHGITPPYVLGSQDAVVRFVARTPGAIGYVAGCYLNSSVRPILTLASAPETAPATETLCPPETAVQPPRP